MGRVTLSYRQVLQYLLIYGILIGNRSVLMKIVGNNIFYLFIIVSGLVALRYCQDVFRKKEILFPCVFLTIAIIVVRLTGGTAGITFVAEMLSMSLLAYTAYRIDVENAATRFIKAVVFFSVISLTCYALSSVFPDMMKSLLGRAYSETITFSQGSGWVSSSEWVYYGKYFYSLGREARNCGLYTEPGLYQIVLVAGLFLLIITPETLKLPYKKIYSYMVIILVTLLTAMSATGLLSALVIFIALILKKQHINIDGADKFRKLKRRATILVSIAILGMILDYVFRGNESLLNVYFFEKLFGMSFSNLDGSTGNARLMALIAGVTAFIRYPLGAGTARVSSIANSLGFGTAAAGCGLFVYLGWLGIVGWLAVVSLTVRPMLRNKKSWQQCITLLVLYVIFGLTQTYVMTPVLLFLAYIEYGKFGRIDS